MKPTLENLILPNTEQSILVFKHEAEELKPYWHYHPEIELTLIISGEGTRYVGDSIAPFQTNDLVLLGKNLPHHWVTAANTKYHKQACLVVQFPEDLFQNFPECKLINEMIISSRRGIQFEFPQQDVLVLLSAILRASKPMRLIYLLEILHKLSGCVNQKILSESSNFNVKISEFNQKRVSACTSYIVENMTQRLTVDFMAERNHMLPQSFCRWFKQNTGHSFISFLNKTRIQSACQYLINTDLSIQDISFRVGFESISHFNRVFKKLLGLPPSRFRKLNSNQSISF